MPKPIKRKEDPDLFRAARLNDPSEMNTALAAGQSLAAAQVVSLFTPLHTAAFNGSIDFLREALLHPSAAPWARDAAGRTALDHAEARRDKDAIKLLYEAMYPGGVNPFRGDESESPDDPTPG